MSTFMAEAALAVLTELTTPLPRAEYHEDMGPVLWWKFPVEEPPYVGSPNDVGFTVEAEVIMRTHSDPGGDGTVTAVTRRNVGGWPDYHTHFTLLPRVEKPK
jgi:hypothetical protein